MKKEFFFAKIILLISFLFSITTSAQTTKGITGVPDSSYSNYNAYISTKKTHPQIKMVEEVHSSAVTETKNITYCSIGQRKLLLDVFSPSKKSKQKSAAIIIIHGGGWRTGNKTQHHAMAQSLAALGYVCFTPEYRLSTEALFPAAVYDIKSVIRWVHANAKQYNIDTTKIAVAGFSAGGQLAALIGASMGVAALEGNDCNNKYSGTVNAVIDMDGILAFVHPESGEGDDSKRTSAATHWFGYSKKDSVQLWNAASALTYVDANTPPTLFINSSVARMHAGRTDFIKVLDSHGIFSQIQTFDDAPHSFPLFHPWFEPTIKYMDEFLKKVFSKERKAKQVQNKKIVVASDGSGDYKTVQQALNAVPYNNKNPVTIFIKNGMYTEKLFLDSTKNFVSIIGENVFNTILTYNDHTGKLSPKGDTINTRTSWSFKILADDFKAENITFQNDAGFTAGQAVAVESDGDRASFKNCRFMGDQDVLFTNSDNSRQYFENCYIEGTTDFIFGSATVWFQQCHIHSKKNSHITAASTPKEKKYGYIFYNSVLTGDSSLHNVSLGRPWRPFAHVAYLYCYIGEHIKAEGWSNWNNTDNYLTTRYSEYKNFGPSSNISTRVKWATQLSDDAAAQYTIKEVFGNWNPQNKME